MSGSAFIERMVAVVERFLDGVVRFLPGLLAALLIVALGFVVAWVVRVVVRRLLTVTGFDAFCEASGVGLALGRADIHQRPSRVAASLLFWVVFACFAMAGLSALEIQVIGRLIAEFFLYLPRALGALLILLAGFLVASFLARAALLAAVNANAPSPRVFALVVRLLITVLAFAMALEQLQIAKNIVLAAFVISFGSVMLALALAFGLGGRDVARRLLERQLPEPHERRSAPDPDELTHV
jgi:hypothetical protein